MKLSLKLREETKQQTQTQTQTPLLRAKIPVTILTLPFLTTVTAGDTADLSFSLRSNFSSGPTLSLSYHPTLSPPPFSLSLKSGIGLFGSPHDSPLTFSAHFHPFSSPPTFSLFVKPRFGNFSLFKSLSSGPDGPGLNGELGNGSVSEFVVTNGPGHGSETGRNSSFFSSVGSGPNGPAALRGSGLNGELGNGSVVDFAVTNGACHGSFFDSVGLGPGGEGGPGVNGELGSGSEAGGKKKWEKRGVAGKEGILSGFCVSARTTMPVGKRAVVNLRWGVSFPGEGGRGARSGMPVLVMNKISLERVEEGKKEGEEERRKEEKAKAGDLEVLKGMCGWMRREVEDLQRENREMKVALEGMRLKQGGAVSRGRGEQREVVGKRTVQQRAGEGGSDFERWRSNKSGGGGADENGGRDLKKVSSGVSDLESELQKAIKAASS